MIPVSRRPALQHKAHGLKMVMGPSGQMDPDEFIAMLDRDEVILLKEQAEYEASLKSA